MSALDTELLGVRVKGCYFHFTQALWRKVASLGLVAAYRRDRHLRKCIQKIMALGFLPVAVVMQCFNNYVTSRRIQRLSRRFRGLTTFLRYVDRIYVNRRTATFRPAQWNVYDRDMTTRTNNNVERSVRCSACLRAVLVCCRLHNDLGQSELSAAVV